MFQFFKNLYRRHHKKLLISSGIAAISYLISIYVRNKINEFQEQLREENATRDLIKKRFSQTQKDCYMTFLSFLPVLVDPIYKSLDVEEITKELKLSRKNKNLSTNLDGKSELNSEDLSSKTENSINDTKINNNNSTKTKSRNELWQELKIKSLTRFLTLIYSETLFIILLHLQLNIISRKSYLKTALKLASKKERITLIDLNINNNNNNNDDDADNIKNNLNSNDKDLSEQAFLSFTWWLLNKGWIKLTNIVNESVENIFNDINLRDEMNIEEFSKLIFEVQKNIDFKLFETKYDYELYDNIEKDEINGNIKLIRLISLILPINLNDEINLLENTNTFEFLTKFNSNLNNSKTLKKMNDELKTYLVSEQVNALSKIISSVGISIVLNNVEQALILKQETKNHKDGIIIDKINDVSNTKWKLAFILAVLTPQTQELANRRLDNKVLYTMNNVKELDDLSASVYSNFDI